MRVWVFTDWNPLNNAEVTLLRWLKCSDVVLGIMSGNGIPSAMFMHKFVMNTIALQNLGLRVHHMYWLSRNRGRIRDIASTIRTVGSRCSPDTILFDAEGSWHQSDSTDPTFTAPKARDFLYEQLGELLAVYGLTGIAPKMHESLDPLAECSHYLLPQAYSIWHPMSESHWSRSNVTEPGTMQRQAFTGWRRVQSRCQSAPLVMGLAAYWTKRPKMSQLDSMSRCIEAVRQLGVNEVAYWSLKHLMSSPRSRHVDIQASERATFIRNLSSDSWLDHPSVPLNEFIKDDYLPTFFQWLLVRAGKFITIDGKWGLESMQALDEFRAETGLDIQPGSPYTNQDLGALVERLMKQTEK